MHTELTVNPQSASGQSYQAAGQLTCASLQCEALKLWHLCRAQSQEPGRAPRTTFSKSSVHTAVVGSRRQERDGRDKGAPFLEAPISSENLKRLGDGGEMACGLGGIGKGKWRGEGENVGESVGEA